MTLIVKNKGNQTLPYSEERMTNYINKIVAENNVSLDEVEVKDFIETIHNYVNSFDSLTIEEVNNKLIIEAQSRIDVGKTDWDIIAERVLLKSLYKTASKNRFYSSDDKYGSFLGLINTLVAQGIYSESLINKYSSNEITELGAEIDAERDKLFTYTGLDLLSSRYLVKTSEGTMELPQERWMIIAMYLMQDETKDRKEKILDSYWALSNLLMTVATPTMANAGHARGQLSSCFPKGTKISTDTGIKPIEEVKEGELAITHDGSRQTVTALNVREDEGGLYTLKNAFDEAEILATAEHPFLVKTSLDEDRVLKDLEGDGTTTNFHWVAMKDIKVDDFVVKGNTSTTDGNDEWIALDGYFGVRVTEITLAEGTNTVYNLEVDTHHTYIAEGYIVHNCFITSPEDSLDGIYKNEFNIARLSKWGGGIGTYLGFLRSRGASIRGVEGASSGIIPWAKGLNNVAVSVDQLGTRAGAINATLDVFHKDILSFIDLRLNNGDDRLRARDIFTSVSIPDLFMEQVEKRGSWFLFDPHEVFSKKGWYLQDFYDEEKGEGSFRDKYNELVNDTNISKVSIPAIEIMKAMMKSQLEGGTPFLFFRDTVNRLNPNKHKGVIYSSNLCMEITQNMSSSKITKEVIDGDNVVITEESGDMVVCNLSSLNLAKVASLDDDSFQRLLSIQYRMLDNVIDLNDLPVPDATITNKKYRAVGGGTFGYHHMLAINKLKWGSQEALDFTDKLYEKINFYAIKASNQLAKEREAYPYFKGSDWETGAYFDLHKYTSLEWQELAKDVAEHGMRNGYLIAVAPNVSTAQIAGSTPSIDPVFDLFYYQENKKGRQPVIAPDLDYTTYEYYGTSAEKQDQFASIKQNAVRQKHIDQSQSFNLYIPNSISASTLLSLFTTAWETGTKTIYYTRSRDTDVEECVWCQ